MSNQPCTLPDCATCQRLSLSEQARHDLWAAKERERRAERRYLPRWTWRDTVAAYAHQAWAWAGSTSALIGALLLLAVVGGIFLGLVIGGGR